MSQSKNNISALELKWQVGLNYRSAWRVKHKLMQVMVERESTRTLLDHVVIDDAYLGGEHKGKAGRGSENKLPFVGFCRKLRKDPNLVRPLVPVTQPIHRTVLQATDGPHA